MRTLSCAGCGATLPVEPDDTHVHCVFCARETEISQSLFAEHRELPQRAGDLEDVGLGLLGRAHLEALRPGPHTLLAAMTVGSSLVVLSFVTMAVVGQVLAAGLGSDGAVVGGLFGLACLAVSVLGPAGWIFGLLLAAPRRADAVLERLRDEARRAPQRGCCPMCAADIVVPTRATHLACASCQAHLLAADGMVVQWVEDAAKQHDLWRREASRVFGAHARAVQRGSNLWGLASAGVPLVLMLLLWGCSGLFSLGARLLG